MRNTNTFVFETHHNGFVHLLLNISQHTQFTMITTSWTCQLLATCHFYYDVILLHACMYTLLWIWETTQYLLSTMSLKRVCQCL